MKKTVQSGVPHSAISAGSEVVAAAFGELPNCLMAAFEVAAFVGCHEETVRRACLRGLLVSQRFGVRGRRFQPDAQSADTRLVLYLLAIVVMAIGVWLLRKGRQLLNEQQIHGYSHGPQTPNSLFHPMEFIIPPSSGTVRQ